MQSLSTTTSLLAALTIATVTGCSAQQPVEARGASSSKLRAPHAVFKGPASAETQRALGISEWRIFRGKTQYVVTGYDDRGKAVKGVAIAFIGSAGGTRASLKGKVLDGSHFSAAHVFGGATKQSASISTLSRTFVSHAVHDMVALRQGVKTSITHSAVRTGQACGGDMVKIVQGSLSCMTAANASGSSVSRQLKTKQCAAAASSAAKAATSCQNAGAASAPAAGAPSGSSGGKTQSPSSSGGKAPSSSKGSASQTDEEQDAQQDKEDAKQEEADRKQDEEQDKELAKEEEAPADDPQNAADKAPDPAQEQQDAQADEKASGAADAAADDQSCTSCDGTAASDIQASDDTGDVTAADSSAADIGGGGDIGGGDPGGGE